MADDKVTTSHVDSEPYRFAEGEPNVLTSEKEGTTADKSDMDRMGKRQETRRNFRHVTILGFSMVILATWEAILATAVFALGNGGTAGLIWGYLIVMTGFGFVSASLAEMASMQVTSRILNDFLGLTGSQGSYFGRAVPLGQRVCATQLPEIFELRRRVVGSTGLADRSRDGLVSGWKADPRAHTLEQRFLRSKAMAGHAADLGRTRHLLGLQHLLVPETATG